jgi:phosphoribosyl 1,2-cyclic phosphodiesterase
LKKQKSLQKSKIRDTRMKVKFWGVRGSIASPGPKTVRYGGNTTCIEIRTDNNELIILDAGTGIFPLSQTLLSEMPVTANVLITHSHWDHIQGLPFFIPNFIPGNTLRLHGSFDPVTGKGIEQVMSVQLQYSYFPVREAEMKARIEYVTLTPGQSIQIGTARVTPFLLNHPVIDFGYRIENNGKSIFFTGDHEPPYNIYDPNEDGYAEYQVFVDEKLRSIQDAINGVDVLIADSSYTDAEYPGKKGWGHGTFSSSIASAHAAGVKRLYCTHHEPTRSDDALDTAFQDALLTNAHLSNGMDIHLAREGDCYEF